MICNGIVFGGIDLSLMFDISGLLTVIGIIAAHSSAY